MRICVVGSGGREHALADVLGRHHEVVVTPGNPGIPGSIPEDPESVDADLFVIGPEAPLVDGLADRLRAAGRLVFGPGADGARLEGSKAWMKEVVAAAGVPTARHATFTERDAAVAFLESLDAPWVIKTDGLAAGKGVLVTDSLDRARDAVDEYLSGEAFGDAGRTVVVEEGMVGPELSVLAICDGTRAVALAPAQDFKRVGDGDAGPNTGGMGAYCPTPFVDGQLLAEIEARILVPTVHAMRRAKVPFHGVLYAGLMLTAQGPKVLEFNARFGDPECEALLVRLESSLLELLDAATDRRLEAVPSPTWRSGASVTVVMAAEGYPGPVTKGRPMRGLDAAGAIDGVQVFQAATRLADGQPVSDGGRVLAVTAVDESLARAKLRAYTAVKEIRWQGAWCRKDIADKGLLREREILAADPPPDSDELVSSGDRT